jgi:hypothetical protein
MKTYEKLFKLDKEYHEARQAIILGKDVQEAQPEMKKVSKNTTKALTPAEANEIISKLPK